MELTDIVALIIILLVMGVWGWVIVGMDHRAARSGLPPGGRRDDGKPP